jgi:hypothetical protein
MTAPALDRPQRVPVVWLINEGGHDYTKAERFGRVMPITTGSINSFNPDRLMVVISTRLRVAAVDDFLTISGSPMLNALAIAMWLRRFGKANILQWSFRDDEYKHLVLSEAALNRLAIAE